VSGVNITNCKIVILTPDTFSAPRLRQPCVGIGTWPISAPLAKDAGRGMLTGCPAIG